MNEELLAASVLL